MNTEKNVIVLYGSSEFHERLTFTKPAPEEITDNIASYCDELVCRINNCGEEEDYRINASITANGICTELSDEKAFVEAAKSLRNAESFEFDAYVDAHYVTLIHLREIDDTESEDTGRVHNWLNGGLLSCIAQLNEVDGFEYKQIAFYPNSGEFGYFKIKDSKRVDIDSLANNEFPLTVNDTSPWYSYNLGLSYNLDSITDEQAEKVHEIVERYIPEHEIGYCMDYWEEDNCCILGGIQWTPQSFRQVADFLGELNAVVENPASDKHMSSAAATAFNAWFDMKNFGIVFMEEVDGKFVLLGTDF